MRQTKIPSHDFAHLGVYRASIDNATGERPIRAGGRCPEEPWSTVDGSPAFTRGHNNVRREQGDCRTLVYRILGESVEPGDHRRTCRPGHPLRILDACAPARP